MFVKAAISVYRLPMRIGNNALAVYIGRKRAVYRLPMRIGNPQTLAISFALT